MSSAKAPVGAEFCFPIGFRKQLETGSPSYAASPLGNDKKGRGLLERLATYPAMKTEVWEKLPSEPKDFEGTIIAWAFFGLHHISFVKAALSENKS